MLSTNELVKHFNMLPHPEGGYYKETYRSNGVIYSNSLDPEYKGERNYSTCIYFLLTSDVFSAFHRIIQDEIWHFYDGSPIHLHLITKDGAYSKTVIGRDIDQGEVPQFVVPGGAWFAATVVNPQDFSLIGCTVAPGFDFSDFELATRTELVNLFPHHKDIISKLTREKG